MTQPFTIYVMQLAHTDIGYTHPQEVIERMYLDFYDKVLAFCRQTEQEVEETRFKWTCETFWQVRHYLQHRPEQEEEFLHYVRNGQIEIAALYLHFTDMIDSAAYRRSVELAVEYCRSRGVPLKSGIHSDINGWPWSVADILHDFGIPFFCSHVHLDSATDPLGKRGSIHYMWHKQYPEGSIASDAPIRVPQLFWWQGPGGGRVLHWLNEHYHMGNVLGLSGNRNFCADKSRYFTEADVTSSQHLYELAQRELPRYLSRLKTEGYPFDILPLTTSGFFVDNSPPDLRWCEIIATWNREHEEIQLKTATMSEWFEALQALYPETLDKPYPTYRVAWPDYWAHGLGSATKEVAMARRTQRRRETILSLVEQSRDPQAQSYVESALEQERLSLEHTFGAWSTTVRPGSSLNAFQLAYKELTYHRADLYLTEAADTSLRALYTKHVPSKRLYVKGSVGLHSVHFRVDDFQLDPQRQVFYDAQGTRYSIQADSVAPSSYIAVLPLQSETQGFDLIDESQGEERQTMRQEAAQFSLTSAAWHLTLDPVRGRLLSLMERESGRDWIHTEHSYGFGQLLHEQIVHPWGRRAVSNFARLLALGVAGEQLRQEMPDIPVFEHSVIDRFTSQTLQYGSVFDEITLENESATFGSVEVRWRVYHVIPLVELIVSWNKPWSDLPEAAYVAFPFAVPTGKVLFETGGGFFQPGLHEAGGQLPSTCSTYYTIQRAAHIISGDTSELLWLPIDAPLVMPNVINFNLWETEPWQWNGFLASMPVNHYWHTNFPASQRGPIHLRYRFISPRGFATREKAIQTAMPVDALGWY